MPKPRGRKHSRNNDPFAGIRRNSRIRVPKIRVVGPDGHQYGIMDTRDALSIAQEAGLDLVEVAGQARPPVCRIMDFGKYVYEQQKKTKDNKGSSSKTKEVKFRPRVELHDYETKLRRAEEFLDKGNKVKLSLFFRGREMAYKDLGFETINRAIKDLETMGHLDNHPKLVGRTINAMISPLPVNKRNPKYYVRKEASEGEEVDVPDEEDVHDEDESDVEDED